MQLYRFKRGGVTPLHRRHEGKTLSSGASIERMPAPEKVCISMVQGAGAPAKPVVKPSDLVTVGQLIAEPAGFIGTRIHASVSGVVKGIVEMPTVAGGVADVYKRQAREDSIQVFHPRAIGSAACKAHIQCDSIITVSYTHLAQRSGRRRECPPPLWR